jgi:hypothetical protein
MTLLEALAFLPNKEKEHVETILATFANSTGLCLRARTNLGLESRLPHASWTSLFNVLLLTNLGDDITIIRKAITDGLRPWTLHGPPLTLFKPEYFGRAVSFDYFCRFLVDGGYFGSMQTAKRSIQNLLLKSQEVIATRLQNYPLGKYLMWSTFTIGNNQHDPFEGMPNSAEVIRGVLGLDPNERDKPLLLIVYTLPSDVTPLFPTVAEAYASVQWNYFFTPAPREAAYGLTLPWPQYEDYAPRPEIVHKVISGGRITTPIKKVL